MSTAKVILNLFSNICLRILIKTFFFICVLFNVLLFLCLMKCVVNE